MTLIKDTETVTFACGHELERDFSQTPKGERAGLKKWFEKKKCFDCDGSKKQLSAEVKAEREAEREAAQERAEQFELPPLKGSEKQVDWGNRVRDELLFGLYDVMVQQQGAEESAFTDQVLVPARRIDRARWWIDNRETDVSDIGELIADPGESALTAPENPF